MKFFTTLVLFLLAFSPMMNAQTGYSITDAITVDLNTSPIVLTNVFSKNSTSGLPSGIMGSPSHCDDILLPVIVYKVIVPQEGSLHIKNSKKITQSTFIQTYTATANPTTWSDLTNIDGEGGNGCTYTVDSTMIGRKYNWWGIPAYWRATGSTIAAGTYYVLFANYNNVHLTGEASDLTFEFVPYCDANPQPDIEVKGFNVSILDGDNTPSTTDNTDYGTMVASGSTVARTFIIKNNSLTTPLNISNVNISGTNAANFSVVTSPASIVAANSSTSMLVQFAPSVYGENTATVEITSDDCEKTLFNFDLKANVLAEDPSDKRGNMMSFDGVDDYVNIDNVAAKMDGLDDFTFEAWVYFDASQSGKGRIAAINDNNDGKNGGNFILTINNGTIEVHDGSSTKSYNDNANPVLNAWNHIALSHDNTHFNVYINGVLAESKTASLSTFTSTRRWSLGQEWDTNTPSDFFNGKMDEVRIWKDVRTEAEIKASMNLSFTMADIASLENLVAYYQFDNDAAAGTTDGVKDVLGNHGTSIGCAYSASEVAVGNGISETQTVNAAGTYDFSTVGVELEFITTGGEALPNGDIIITKLTTEGAKNVSGGQLANKPETYWVIRNLGTNAGLNCNVKMKFDDGSIDDNLTANHKVHKRGSNQFGTGDWTDLTPSSVDNTSGNNHITVNVTSFSQFAPSSSSSDFVATLPVELISFNAKLEKDNQVELTWTTANELNNEGFEIERLNSNNGKFESIGWKTGNGSTERLSTYKFTDYNDFKGVSYYRLKQIDFDGQFDYSNVVVIENRGEENPLMIFPNPVKNELNIRNGEGLATIYNLLGQPVKQLSIDNQQLTLNVSDLTEGQYVLHIQKENGTVITKRFVK